MGKVYIHATPSYLFGEQSMKQWRDNPLSVAAIQLRSELMLRMRFY